MILLNGKFKKKNCLYKMLHGHPWGRFGPFESASLLKKKNIHPEGDDASSAQRVSNFIVLMLIGRPKKTEYGMEKRCFTILQCLLYRGVYNDIFIIWGLLLGYLQLNFMV